MKFPVYWYGVTGLRKTFGKIAKKSCLDCIYRTLWANQSCYGGIISDYTYNPIKLNRRKSKTEYDTIGVDFCYSISFRYLS